MRSRRQRRFFHVKGLDQELESVFDGLQFVKGTGLLVDRTEALDCKGKSLRMRIETDWLSVQVDGRVVEKTLLQVQTQFMERSIGFLVDHLLQADLVGNPHHVGFEGVEHVGRFELFELTVGRLLQLLDKVGLEGDDSPCKVCLFSGLLLVFARRREG